MADRIGLSLLGRDMSVACEATGGVIGRGE
jgi:hypothetical protein